MKLQVGRDHGGSLPAFMRVPDGGTSDIEAARALRLPTGSIVAAHRAHVDFAWTNRLISQGVFLVTRMKRGVRHKILERRPVKPANRRRGTACDQTIAPTSERGKKRCPHPLRRVGFRDPDTGRRCVLLTTSLKLSAQTIANICKSRWQVELFFKWIKQRLKMKAFVGTSRNAVLTQLWIAMCVHLLPSFLKFANRIAWSLHEILRVLQLNLFDRRPIMDLLKPKPPDPSARQPQLTLKLA